MTNFLFGVSLTLNIILIIGIFIYIKIKLIGIKKYKKELQDKFYSDDELEHIFD